MSCLVLLHDQKGLMTHNATPGGVGFTSSTFTQYQVNQYVFGPKLWKTTTLITEHYTVSSKSILTDTQQDVPQMSQMEIGK